MMEVERVSQYILWLLRTLKLLKSVSIVQIILDMRGKCGK